MNDNLYEKLQNLKQDLQILPKKLITGAVEAPRFKELVQAFEVTAQKIANAINASANSLDRANLNKLYQGILAGQRIIEKLYEQGLRSAR
ncbi:hypothetical protein [Mycoavidus sp. B2-EB]|uniref:hypothetical protein n=1 Tax=Mycoavidus sp. B2-EB TaxID=2651972 RepID=UPI0016243687|nr:hypothetical protein [Mycoavidus sp. B2-EB]BBO59486.1 hypothetical protein MPB2EB_0605 [Mycoavidus sp. B2-EB]